MIFPWIWARLPGRRLPARLVSAVVLVAITALLLWFAVFPLVDTVLGLDDGTVGS
jgi:hypothetical protein